MVIASLTTFLAFAFVLAVIGYRLFRGTGSAPAPPAELSAMLPAGAKVVASAVGDGRVVLTIEVGGALELRSFDLDTLKPLAVRRLHTNP